jgi:hypothetical protein
MTRTRRRPRIKDLVARRRHVCDTASQPELDTVRRSGTADPSSEGPSDRRTRWSEGPFADQSGGRGIRTHEDGDTALTVFKTVAIGH